MISTAKSRPIRNSFPLHFRQYNPFHLLNMAAHGLLGGQSISTADRREDTAVSRKRFLRAPFDLQGALAALPQKIHEKVQNFQHDAVLRGAGNGVMEFGVLFNGQLATINFLFLAPQDVFEAGKVFGGGVLGGTRSKWRLNDLPQIQQFAYELALPRKHRRQRTDQRRSGEITNSRSFSLAGLNKTHHFERAE